MLFLARLETHLNLACAMCHPTLVVHKRLCAVTFRLTSDLANMPQNSDVSPKWLRLTPSQADVDAAEVRLACRCPPVCAPLPPHPPCRCEVSLFPQTHHLSSLLPSAISTSNQNASAFPSMWTQLWKQGCSRCRCCCNGKSRLVLTRLFSLRCFVSVCFVLMNCSLMIPQILDRTCHVMTASTAGESSVSF